MIETGFGLPELMEDLGRRGVSVLLKVDHERFGFRKRPWTLMLSGPGLGESASFHSDFRSLREALDRGLSFLRGLPGDWDWLDSYPLDPE
jgi:hypothetical protein